MIRSITALILLCWSSTLLAVSIRLDFESAVRSSPLVAWVEIESGEKVVTASGLSCGARYIARVVRSIKGAVNGQQIQFGYFFGRSIGKQYFIFLQPTDEVVRRLSGIVPAPSMTNPVPYKAECQALLPEYLEIAEGAGTIAVDSGDQVGYRPAVSLQNPPYLIPTRLVGSRRHTGAVVDAMLFGSAQIEAETFFEYLQSLTDSK